MEVRTINRGRIRHINHHYRGHKMKIWQCVVWLSAVTLEVSHSQSPDQEERIREALDLYNQREDVLYFYKPLEDLPAIPIQIFFQEETKDEILRFGIMETRCLKSEGGDAARCEFKPDGEVQICDLNLTAPGKENMQCDIITKISRRRRPCRPNRPNRPGCNSSIGFLRSAKRAGLQ
ncbi:cathelicidin-6-like isoform X1 [Aquarana catesbeiana]|uniref:cathelicidin-6-like isoform X1 n=1 Tax=Aquarana catesbeiana TaxID=8400 RepID=UPI003CC9D6CE